MKSNNLDAVKTCLNNLIDTYFGCEIVAKIAGNNNEGN